MIANLLISIISGFLSIIFNITALFGGISGPSTENPIKLADDSSCNASFVVLSDTHLRDTSFQPHYFSCALEDIDNAEDEIDALVISGDITEMSDDAAFRVTFEALDNSNIGNRKVLLATGNHDIRLDYKGRTELIMSKNESYLGIDIDKPYYSYDLDGCTFIVMGSDAWQFEKAVISDEQVAFIDSELSRAEALGQPAFVICHQPLDNTHGLPEVWVNGGLGKDSAKVKEVFMKHSNVFYINGHLHDGVYEKSLEIFDGEKGVYSINLPSFGKTNDYGKYNQKGLGVIVEVYDDEIIFTLRDFIKGEPCEGYTYTFDVK